MSKSRLNQFPNSPNHRSIYPSAPPQEAYDFGPGFLPLQPPPYTPNPGPSRVAPPVPAGPPPPFPGSNSNSPSRSRETPRDGQRRNEVRPSSAPPKSRNNKAKIADKNKKRRKNTEESNLPLRRATSEVHFAENIYEEINEHTGKFQIKPIARFQLKQKPHKKYNPQLYTKRSCTDVFCCLLFMFFIAGWVVVATLGFAWGNPERLIYPTDSQGRRCGVQRNNAYDLRSKPYLFYFDLTKCISYATALGGCPTTQICVSQCPQNTWTYLQMQAIANDAEFMKTVKTNVICEEDVDKNTITSFSVLKNLVNQGRCASYTVKSAAVLQRCIPQAIVSAADTAQLVANGNMSLDYLHDQFGNDVPRENDVKESSNYVGEAMTNSDGVLTKIIHDVLQTWWQTLSLIAIAGILAFIWTIIMRIFGGFMIWTSILVVIFVLTGGCAYSWLKWKNLKAAGAIDDFSFSPIFSVYFEMPTTWLIFSITISVILLIVLLIIIFIRKRISIAVALIEESSKAVGSMMSTLIFPIFPFVLHLIIFAVWGTIAVWLASTGKENCRLRDAGTGKVSNSSAPCDCLTLDTNPNCVFLNVTKEEDKVFWLQLYNIFAFFWMSCFVTALGDIALAGAFASYYWAKNKSKDVPSFPVLRSLGRAIRYNLGSLAFGSLIIAIIKLARVILEYLDQKLAKTNSKVVKTILSALKCCFWCLEVFLKFLTKNAYIMMAIYGKPFFTSAKDSFFLLARNAIRSIVIHQVAGILLFIGKAMITVGMGVVAFYYFSGQWIVEGIPRVEVYYYFVPIVVVLIGSYFIADLFFDTYEMAVDTTFICFLEDSEHNDGSPEKPYYMSKNLLDILGKTNKKEKSKA